MTELIIASRASPLALWQAEYIQARLHAMHPALAVRIESMTTQGDRILEQSLSKIGGKGLFVKELEQALHTGRADLAVHSMKDMPMHMPDGFALAAICEREDPRDALVSNRYATVLDLPVGAVIGTSSLRRESQLRARFPHLVIKPLRGNVQTRLAKLDAGDFDAIILASAGLKRLGLTARIAELLAPELSVPAVGQGALGIEVLSARAAELAPWLASLHHAPSAACIEAERAMGSALQGSCQVPLGGYATLSEGVLTLCGFVASVDGTRTLRAQASAPQHAALALGHQVAQHLLAQGAAEIIAAALSAT